MLDKFESYRRLESIFTTKISKILVPFVPYVDYASYFFTRINPTVRNKYLHHVLLIKKEKKSYFQKIIVTLILTV